MREVFNDVFYNNAGGILAIDVFYDFCLIFINYQFLVYNLVSIGRLSSEPVSLVKTFDLPAANLLRKLGAVIFCHALEKRFKDDTFGRIGNVFHSGNEPDAVIAQGFTVHSHFVFVTRKTIEFVNKNDFPFMFGAVTQHSLKVFAVVVFACHGAVDISTDNF